MARSRVKAKSLTAQRNMIRNLHKRENRPRQAQIQYKQYKKAGGKSTYASIVK